MVTFLSGLVAHGPVAAPRHPDRSKRQGTQVQQSRALQEPSEGHGIQEGNTTPLVVQADAQAGRQGTVQLGRAVLPVSPAFALAPGPSRILPMPMVRKRRVVMPPRWHPRHRCRAHCPVVPAGMHVG